MVPSRQRAHAARLAYAAAQLSSGARVWATPDILTVDAWLIRETEGIDSLPRVLSPAEDWLIWRQCTTEATRDLDLLNRGALAESLRRASTLATDYQIALPTVSSFAGAEAELLSRTQLAVNQRYRDLDAANIQSLVSNADFGGSAEVTCAGFLQASPRLRSLGTAFRSVESVLARPDTVIAADESDELESIAQWCKRKIALNAETRLLVVLPGSAGARERLATLVRQAVDPDGWLSGGVGGAGGAHVADAAGDATGAGVRRGGTGTGSLVAIEGGAPLSELAVVAHALATLRWLGGSSGEFEEVSEWLRAPYWDSPNAALRARIDLWLRERGEMSVDGRDWGAILSAAPANIAEGAHEFARQIGDAVKALGGGVVSPRDWSERFRAALDAVHWPGERVRDSSEQQTVVRLHELLDEFGQLASSARAMARDEAIHWFNELASHTAFRPADDDAVVTISSAFADPVVLYDGIWVAGLHAEAFPQPVQPDPFLPLPAQVAAGIPAASAAGRLAEARALLRAWRAATGELVLSTPGTRG